MSYFATSSRGGRSRASSTLPSDHSPYRDKFAKPKIEGKKQLRQADLDLGPDHVEVPKIQHAKRKRWTVAGILERVTEPEMVTGTDETYFRWRNQKTKCRCQRLLREIYEFRVDSKGEIRQRRILACKYCNHTTFLSPFRVSGLPARD